jgi:hypothetical protein
MSVATPACFGGPYIWKILFYPFTLSQCLSLSVRYFSCGQQVVRSCFLFPLVCLNRSYFLTQLAILCLLIGELRPLIFNVHIERYMVLPHFVVHFFRIPHMLIYSSSRVYSFQCFLGCIYLPHLCVGFL